MNGLIFDACCRGLGSRFSTVTQPSKAEIPALAAGLNGQQVSCPGGMPT